VDQERLKISELDGCALSQSTACPLSRGVIVGTKHCLLLLFVKLEL